MLTVDAVKASDWSDHHGLRRHVPDLPGKHYEDWVPRGPGRPGVAAVRPIRDEIKRRIVDLLERIDA